MEACTSPVVRESVWVEMSTVIGGGSHGQWLPWPAVSQTSRSAAMPKTFPFSNPIFRTSVRVTPSMRSSPSLIPSSLPYAYARDHRSWMLRPVPVCEIASTNRMMSSMSAFSMKNVMSNSGGDMVSGMDNPLDADIAGRGGDMLNRGESDTDASKIGCEREVACFSSPDGGGEALVDFFFFLDAEGMLSARGEAL